MRKVVAGIIVAMAVFAVVIRLVNLHRQATLVGKYTATSEGYKYSLRLKPDGTYSQTITDPYGQEYTNAGSWEAGYSQGEHRIKLRNFKWFRRGKLENAGLWDAVVGRTLFGRTALEFADLLVFFYSSSLRQEKEPNE